MENAYTDRYPDVPVSLASQLDRCCELAPDHIAVIDQTVRLSWAQLRRQVNIVAAELIDMGVQPGDRVLVGMEKRFELVIAFLAIARAGAVSVPFNFKGSTEEQTDTIQLTEPVAGCFHSDLIPFMEKSLGKLQRIVLDSGKWSKRLQTAAQNSASDLTGEWPEIKPDTIAYLNMTSGSTGKPKAASASHRQLFANTLACVQKLKLTEDDVHLPLFAVMSHPHEIFCRALFTAATIVLVEKLYPRTISEAISAHKVTCMMAVSAVYNLLLPFLDSKKYDFSTLRIPESGGMPTPPAVVNRYRDNIGVPVVSVWGSTETMGVAFASSLDGTTPSDSVGTALPGYQVRIVDKDENPLTEGEVGEMQIRGIGVMSGYWQDPDNTSRAFSGEFYKTGDLFELDANGNYFFRGRMDAMIKAGGVKIYPAEIEAAIFAHPLVREAVVVPFDDRLRGLVPMAVIVSEPGESITESQIRSFLKDRLSKGKIPRIFRFLPDLPRTASGKVDRKALLSFSGLDEKPSEKSLEHRLDAIDLKILHLLNERMRIEKKLMEYKDGPGFQPERTQETIKRILEFNPGPLHDSIVEQIFRSLLSLRTLYQD